MKNQMEMLSYDSEDFYKMVPLQDVYSRTLKSYIANKRCQRMSKKIQVCK